MASDVTKNIRITMQAARDEMRNQADNSNVVLRHQQAKVEELQRSINEAEQYIKEIDLFLLNNPEPPTPDEDPDA